MSKLRVQAFGISLDGYGAGPGQDVDNPMGVGGMALHQWALPTRTLQRMLRGVPGLNMGDEGETGVDDDFAAKGMENLGAWILGRNMFGPIRGPWPDDEWKGWWGSNPPYHVPVFVLTHHPRRSITMEGGTVFHFVTGGIEEALRQAKDAAAGRDVRLGGGVSTVRQYLRSRLVDELHVAINPTLLGAGEHLFGELDLPALGYECGELVPGARATHAVIRKRK